MEKCCCISRINVKGFTLIELLVVVLIIGILSAIALPQYQKAVRRARVTEAKVILKNFTNAQDMYYLRTGNFDLLGPYISDWNDVLDSQFPATTDNWRFYVDECIRGENPRFGCVNTADPLFESGYYIAYESPNYEGGESVTNGHFLCISSNDEGVKKCTDLGGVATENQNYYLLP